jgi:hypothetical protein
MKFKQSGNNPKYPKEIEVWNPSKDINNPPEWMIDNCRVLNIESFDGKIILDYSKRDDGGYEFKNADSQLPGIKTTSESDLICYGDNRIFPLKEVQFKLLYKWKD